MNKLNNIYYNHYEYCRKQYIEKINPSPLNSINHPTYWQRHPNQLVRKEKILRILFKMGFHIQDYRYNK